MLFVLLAASGSVSSSSAETSKSWKFKVYLDDDEVGTHDFSVVDKDDYQEIYSKASFDVKFLFFNAYSYRHENVEQWRGECLQNISAITDDNGDDYKVLGEIKDDSFVINVEINEEGSQDSYQACLKTFAYWDPDFLQEKSLLNSQTGEMIDIESTYIKTEKVNYKGEEVTAKRYRVSGKELQIDLWYSDEDHWLALESLTDGGRVVRYAIP